MARKKPDSELKNPRNPNRKPPPEPVAVEKPLRADSPLSDFEPMFAMIEMSDLGLAHATAAFGVRRPTFLLWCSKRPELNARYKEAKQTQLEFIAESILEIADDGTNDWMERLAFNGSNPGWELNGEHVNRSRLRIESRKWLLAHLMPKVYGDRVINEHQGATSDPSAPGIKIVLVKAEDGRPAQ